MCCSSNNPVFPCSYRHAAPKHAEELWQKFKFGVLQELAKGEVARVAHAVEEGRRGFVVACAEGEAQECLAVHAAHMSNEKYWASALLLDENEGNKRKYREDGEQDEKA